MGLFDNAKSRGISDAKSGKGYKEKNPSEMTMAELEREIKGSKSIAAKRKYAEER